MVGCLPCSFPTAKSILEPDRIMQKFFKTLSILGVAFFTSLSANAGWSTDFAAAKAEAAENDKPLLLNFTGSDWCVWCVRLKDEVFDQAAFKAFAEANFVLVEIDFPRNVEQSDPLKEQNRALAQQFGVRGFPTVWILDASGERVVQTGYQRGGAEAYVTHLKDILGLAE